MVKETLDDDLSVIKGHLNIYFVRVGRRARSPGGGKRRRRTRKSRKKKKKKSKKTSLNII